MPDVVAQLGPLGAGWLLTYLLHSTVLLLLAAGLVRLAGVDPGARDTLGKAAVLGGLVTATTALASGNAALAVQVRSVGAPEWVVEGAAISADPVRAEAIRLAVTGERVEEAMSRTVATGGRRLIEWTAGEPLFDEPVPAELTLFGGAATGPAATLGCIEAARAEAGGDLGRAGLDHCLGDGRASTPWRGALLLLWLVGAGIGAARFAGSRRALGAVRGRLTAAAPRTARIAGRVLGSGVGRVRLRSSSEIDAPCVLPGRIVVLSARAEEDLADHELAAVIAHESAHVLRRDALWFGVLDALAAILWVQPLNRLAVRLLKDNAELVCDDWAVDRTGERVGLAHSIATVAAWTTRPALAGAMPIVRAEGSPSERVRRILSARRARRSPRALRLALLAVLFAPAGFLPAVPARGVQHGVFVLEEGSVTVQLERVEGFGPVGASGDVASSRARILVARFSED